MPQTNEDKTMIGFNMTQIKRNAHILHHATGFSFADCLAELEAEDGDYYAALNRLKQYKAERESE